MEDDNPEEPEVEAVVPHAIEVPAAPPKKIGKTSSGS
jgi:hypothetical protein